MSERIVITGAGGLVGRTLAARASEAGHEVLALRSADCDITDPTALERVVTAGDVVVNCAAFTKVDDAERQEEAAFAVNATGAEHVAHACARAGARLLHISTDYVFDGRFDGAPRPYDIDDPTGPLSVYGRSKLSGEFAVLAAMPDAHVVRTAWIFSGGEGADYVSTMAANARSGIAVEAVADQVSSPTYVGDLVDALLELAGNAAIREPVLHAANDGPGSRYEQARLTYELVGADPELVRPVGTDRHPRPAPRPPYSVLSSQKSSEAGLTPLRGWREALAVALGG